MKRIRNYNPIFIIANSSWYLIHYRKLLLIELKKNFFHLVTLSPFDKYSQEVAKFSLNIPWRVSRSKNKNIISLLISLLRLIFIFRSFKPKLVHSHTLKTNFLTSIASFIYGIPCVISFAGLGQIKNSKGLKRFLMLSIVRFIGFLSHKQIYGKWIIKNEKRTAFIFQNKNDMNFIKELIYIPPSKSILIYGSGVPKDYIKKEKKNYWISKTNSNQNKENLKLNPIYLSRLLKSKGIMTFIKLSKYYSEANFSIFGSIDKSSRDSLSEKDIQKYHLENKNIHFFGNLEKPLINKKFNYPILIVPSLYGEGIPRGIIEALALKIPVISSKEAASGIFNESYIYLSKDNTLKSYIDCINKIISDHKSGKLINKLEKGNIFVKENLQETSIVKKTISVYEYLWKINNL